MPVAMRHGLSDLRISFPVENVRDNVFVVKRTLLRNIKGHPVDAVRRIPAVCVERQLWPFASFRDSMVPTTMKLLVSCPSTNLGTKTFINPLNAELNPICYLLALLAHHFLHVSSISVKSLTLRLLMSYIYIYMEHLFLMFLDHTQRRTTVGRTPLDE